MMTDADLSRNFRALSHPRRAMIFRLIAKRPAVGNSLESLLVATGLRPSSLIHHLREMERCGLVTRRRKGAIVAYRLTPGGFTAALGLALRMVEARPTDAIRAA
jgi:DNA-binding transcriptional ArsR family regulator